MKKLVNFCYKKFMFWFLETELYLFVAKHIMPFIRFTFYYTRFRKFAFARLYSKLKAGDILVSIDYQKLTSKVIGGLWSHAAICVDKGIGKVEVVEMTRNDFNQTDFHKFCSESERVAILRVDDPRFDVQRFIQKTWEQKDSKYNYGFFSKEKRDPRNKHGQKVHKFNYCSQLVMTADDLDVIQANWDDLAGLGVLYVSPTGLARAKNVVMVDDSGLPKGIYGHEEKEKEI